MNCLEIYFREIVFTKIPGLRPDHLSEHIDFKRETKKRIICGCAVITSFGSFKAKKALNL